MYSLTRFRLVPHFLVIDKTHASTDRCLFRPLVASIPELEEKKKKLGETYNILFFVSQAHRSNDIALSVIFDTISPRVAGEEKRWKEERAWWHYSD